MGIILWIIFGAISGWLTSIVMRTNNQQGFFMDLILGVVGAAVGGFIMSLFGQPGVTGFNIYSFFVAIIGGAIVVWASHRLRGV